MKEEFDDNVSQNYHQRKINYLRKRRRIRRLEITLMRARAFSRLIFVVLIIVFLFKLTNSPQWYLNPDIFSSYPNNSLEIQGNKIASDKQILEQLQTVKLPNKPLYLLDTSSIKKAIFNLSPVKKIYIRRFWFPARLKIVIDEKKPALFISPSPKAAPVAVFTDDATIIGKKFLPLSNSKGIYLILTYDDYYKWSINHVKYLIFFSKLLESVSDEKLVYLDIRNPNDVFVQLANVKLRTGELNRNIFKRSKRIGAVLSEAIKIKDDIDYIDLRWENSVSIKLKSKEQKMAEEAQKAKELQSYIQKADTKNKKI